MRRFSKTFVIPNMTNWSGKEEVKSGVERAEKRFEIRRTNSDPRGWMTRYYRDGVLVHEEF